MATGTGNLPNPSMSFSPFAILTAEEMNNLVENIESLATGSGIGDGAITATKINLSSFPKFSVYRNAALNSNNTDTVIPFDTTRYDIGGNVSSNRRFTAPVDGYYHFDAAAGNTAATSTIMRTGLMVNGALAALGNQNSPTTAGNVFTVSHTLYLTAGQYVEATFVGGGGSVMFTGIQCYFSGFRIG